MILKSRHFVKQEPSRDAKLFIIYCEGKKRENHYFNYFKEISSNIRLEVVSPGQHDNNSPTGLYDKASEDIVVTKKNKNPKYEIIKDDEIWFVIDTDTWGKKIDELRTKCEKEHTNWKVAQSNPCFEVWLYYHFESSLPGFEGMEKSENWKGFLHKVKKGGFDSRKHPILVKEGISNSKKNFKKEDGIISIGCTEVFKLADSFYPLVQKVIEDKLLSIGLFDSSS